MRLINSTILEKRLRFIQQLITAVSINGLSFILFIVIKEMFINDIFLFG